MGNFEKLSVLVIVVIIVMILVVALYTWTGDPSGGDPAAASVATANQNSDIARVVDVQLPPRPERKPPVAPQLTPEEILKEFQRAGRKAGEPGPVVPGGMDGSATDPVIAETPKPEAPKEPRFHVVAPGETIGKIAKIEYPGVGQRAIDAILKANPTVDPSRMAINSKLLLPELASADTKVAIESPKRIAPSEPAVATIKPGTIYVTKKGDTLPGLAKRAYRDSGQWHRIWVENFDEIQDTEHLAAGMRLRIPVL